MNVLRLSVLAVVLATVPAVALQAQATKAGKKTETKAVDPVCGMTVDPKTAEKAVYKGKTYYFCARSEKEEFEKDPEKYVSKDKKK
ncbi:MAG: YHS domain-containing protein [Planctomycetes bacterium]|nr:YHS domain-containing protein [Planctomycetota bacterium]